MIIEGVRPFAGQHCETTTLGVLLYHVGVELSEPMMFGLGAGLGFIYWDAKSMDFPFIGGRTRPILVSRGVTDRLGLTLRTEETGAAAKAWRTVADEIAAGRPVGLQLDCYHLDYFTSKVHFGGHFVAMYGYDDAHAYLVDTAPQGGRVQTTLGSLAAARAERGPMTARNLSYTIARAADPLPLSTVVGAAVRANAEDFLDPPIANLGYKGIAKAARLVPGWLDRSTEPRHDLTLAATLMERGGTGGALFRNLYRDFLAECVALVDDDGLRRAHRMFNAIAPRWTEVSEQIAAAGETGNAGYLAAAGETLRDLAHRERAAMRALAEVRS
jgi:hypothetical protein